MVKPYTGNYRYSQITKERLDEISSKYSYQEADVIRLLIRRGFELLQDGITLIPNTWRNAIIEKELDFFAEKERIRLGSETFMFDLREGSKDKDRKLTRDEKKKDRQFTKEEKKKDRNLKIMGDWLKTRTESEKKEFFSREFHVQKALYGEEVQALPNKLESGKIEIYINGIRVLVDELLEDNLTPKLDFNQDRLVPCDKGFHTKGTWCSQCSELTTCPVLRKERVNALGSRLGDF